MASNDLLKGMLKPIILKLLLEKERMYGYEITQLVKEISEGEIELTFGALYPILHKLEQEGIVKTESEIINNRNRIYYSLTKSGNSKAKEKIAELEEFIKTLKIFFKPNFGLKYVFAR
jgi:PadR family transcriptional regulator, regulatory protein PadR